MCSFRKLLFFTFITIVVTICSIRYNQLTDGFSIWQIRSSLGNLPQFNISYSSEKKAAVERILNQEFRYLGKGCQFYAFESKDGQYILKFFKHKHLRSFNLFSTSCRKERVEKLFTSCKIAYERIPEESGILYMQLNRQNGIKKKVTLIDKIGHPLAINLKEFEFCIQKKGTPLKQILNQLNATEIAHLNETIASLVRRRCEKGVKDNDPAVVQNVALTKESALWIDVGQLSIDESLKQAAIQDLEVSRRLDSLHLWMQEHLYN